MNQEICKTKERTMSTSVAKNSKFKTDLSLLNEVDDLIMEGWSEDMTIGDTLDSMPANLRDFFLNLSFDTPIKTQDGTYTITFRA
jgi:hypothetical protein